MLLDPHEVKRVVMAGALTTGVILSMMWSLSDRDYVIYILRDAVLDSVNASFLLDTYFLMQKYVITVDEAIGMLPNGTVDPDSVNGFNVLPRGEWWRRRKFGV